MVELARSVDAGVASRMAYDQGVLQSYENPGFSRGSSVSSKKAIISPEDIELNDESFLSDLERDSAHSSMHEGNQRALAEAAYEKKYMELQRQSQRGQRPTSAKKQRVPRYQPRYPILDTSQIQIRLEEESERRQRIVSNEHRNPQNQRTPKVPKPNPMSTHRPQPRLSNLWGVIDTSKLRGLCSDYDDTGDQRFYPSSSGLEPIPEASAPPLSLAPSNVQENTPTNENPSPALQDSPYRTYSEYQSMSEQRSERSSHFMSA